MQCFTVIVLMPTQMHTCSSAARHTYNRVIAFHLCLRYSLPPVFVYWKPTLPQMLEVHVQQQVAAKACRIRVHASTHTAAVDAAAAADAARGYGHQHLENQACRSMFQKQQLSWELLAASLFLERSPATKITPQKNRQEKGATLQAPACDNSEHSSPKAWSSRSYPDPMHMIQLLL